MTAVTSHDPGPSWDEEAIEPIGEWDDGLHGYCIRLPEWKSTTITLRKPAFPYLRAPKLDISSSIGSMPIRKFNAIADHHDKINRIPKK